MKIEITENEIPENENHERNPEKHINIFVFIGRVNTPVVNVTNKKTQKKLLVYARKVVEKNQRMLEEEKEIVSSMASEGLTAQAVEGVVCASMLIEKAVAENARRAHMDAEHVTAIFLIPLLQSSKRSFLKDLMAVYIGRNDQFCSYKSRLDCYKQSYESLVWISRWRHNRSHA